MVGTTVAALIAAAAAILGGVLTAFATRSVERLRQHAAMVEKAEERRLAAIETFILATTTWLDWLDYIRQDGWRDKHDELSARVRVRDEAYRRLLLLAPDDLHQWLKTVYLPLELQVRETYVHELRADPEPRVSEEALAVRREFSTFLRNELVDRMRPEVKRLRDPLG
ncbi:hypothetical protein [Actinocrispum sp. NPDC049592]|uniref:hypothetical protein n=1 Tax=Actinocrispum sp. NPDC049592 TaxID=3154835 RepID=UPI0034218019